jgi:hypothetical protein
MAVTDIPDAERSKPVMFPAPNSVFNAASCSNKSISKRTGKNSALLRVANYERRYQILTVVFLFKFPT